MSDDELKPYYVCFCGWLGIMNPGALFAFERGIMDFDKVKPLIREWAADITNKENK